MSSVFGTCDTKEKNSPPTTIFIKINSKLSVSNMMQKHHATITSLLLDSNTDVFFQWHGRIKFWCKRWQHAIDWKPLELCAAVSTKNQFQITFIELVSRFHPDHAKEQPTLTRQTLVRWTNQSISWNEMLSQKLHMAIVSENVTLIVRLGKRNHSSFWHRMPVSELYNFPENLWFKYNFGAVHSACFPLYNENTVFQYKILFNSLGEV